MQLRIPLALALLVSSAHAGAVFTAATSTTIAGLQPAIDAFRVSIGGGTTAGPNGSFGGVRREINWDGVPDISADPALMPATFFATTSPRGLGLSGAVQGFMVSANPGQSAAPLFESFDGAGQGNGTYDFQAFSANRLFAPVGGTQMDVTFFTPGTGFADPSFTLAFGVIFVDNTHSTFPACASIQMFNGATSLGFRCADPASAGGFSFLGVTATGADIFTTIRLNVGNANLGVAQDATHDVVVMDDFIYAEPGLRQLGSAVPEPGATTLMGAGLLVLAASSRRWLRK